MAKGELQLLDVAEPPVVSGSRNAPVDVGLDGDQAMGLARVDLQEAASYARVFVRAASAVRPHAVAELDAASAEVFTKLGELVGRRLAVFIDRTPALRQLARHLIATQKEMADLARDAHIVRALGANNAQLKELLVVWEDFHRQWITQRLPSLTAAMRLALEVYDTFGSGMISLDDPIEADIWNNKYFVWERELSPALDEPDRYA